MAKTKLVLLLALTALALYLAVGMVIAYKLTHVKRQEISRTPADLGLAFSDIEFQSQDGLTLSGWRVQPQTNAHTSVIFVHGNESNRAQHHHLELAKHFATQGISSFLFDLRGRGQSEGSLVSGGFFERRDVIAAVNQEPGANCRILFGSSLGGATALLAAEELGQSIDGVIVDSAYANIADLLATEIERSLSVPARIARIFIPATSLMAKAVYGIELFQLVPTNVLSKLPYPILIIHGQDDTRIPVEHARRLYQAAPAGSQLLIVESADHTLSFVRSTEQYLAAVDEYIKSSCGNR